MGSQGTLHTEGAQSCTGNRKSMARRTKRPHDWTHPAGPSRETRPHSSRPSPGPARRQKQGLPINNAAPTPGLFGPSLESHRYCLHGSTAQRDLRGRQGHLRWSPSSPKSALHQAHWVSWVSAGWLACQGSWGIAPTLPNHTGRDHSCPHPVKAAASG